MPIHSWPPRLSRQDADVDAVDRAAAPRMDCRGRRGPAGAGRRWCRSRRRHPRVSRMRADAVVGQVLARSVVARPAAVQDEQARRRRPAGVPRGPRRWSGRSSPGTPSRPSTRVQRLAVACGTGRGRCRPTGARRGPRRSRARSRCVSPSAGAERAEGALLVADQPAAFGAGPQRPVRASSAANTRCRRGRRARSRG